MPKIHHLTCDWGRTGRFFSTLRTLKTLTKGGREQGKRDDGQNQEALPIIHLPPLFSQFLTGPPSADALPLCKTQIHAPVLGTGRSLASWGQALPMERPQSFPRSRRQNGQSGLAAARQVTSSLDQKDRMSVEQALGFLNSHSGRLGRSCPY